MYDVLNGQGVLVYRVQVRSARTIVGFGAGAVGYPIAGEPNQ